MGLPSEGIYDKKIKEKNTVGFRILVSCFGGENRGCNVSAQPPSLGSKQG